MWITQQTCVGPGPSDGLFFLDTTDYLLVPECTICWTLTKQALLVLDTTDQLLLLDKTGPVFMDTTYHLLLVLLKATCMVRSWFFIFIAKSCYTV